jgi:hypothetical protein
MKCVILQPAYIPWRGYFHQIQMADVFVFYDDVQYDKHGWRNRNRIKTHQGPRWLTIPVHSQGVTVENIPIDQVEIDWGQPWNRKHWQTIRQAYSRAPFFDVYAPLVKAFYARCDRCLADFDIALTLALVDALGITHTRFLRSSELNVPGKADLTGGSTGRLVRILQILGADHYISGPSAAGYLEDEQFRAAGITLEYMRYDYPQYPQLHPPYDPQVSILDLLFMTGPEAIRYIEA